MTQTILAGSIVLLAIFYGVFQLVKFFIPVKQKHAGSCGSDNCSCH